MPAFFMLMNMNVTSVKPMKAARNDYLRIYGSRLLMYGPKLYHTHSQIYYPEATNLFDAADLFVAAVHGVWRWWSVGDVVELKWVVSFAGVLICWGFAWWFHSIFVTGLELGVVCCHLPQSNKKKKLNLGYLSFLYDDSLMLTASFGDSALRFRTGLKRIGKWILANYFAATVDDHGDDGVLKSEISGCGKFLRTRCFLGMVCENFRGQVVAQRTEGQSSAAAYTLSVTTQNLNVDWDADHQGFLMRTPCTIVVETTGFHIYKGREIVLKAILQKAKEILLLTKEIKTIRLLTDLEISEKHDKGEYVGVQSDSDIEENESSDINVDGFANN
ncbi:hypothetical protein Tco_0128700 [Tanacetum coccineum]